MKKYILFGLLLGMFLLSGCISYEFYHKIAKDGKSEFQVTYDVSQILALTMQNQPPGTSIDTITTNMSTSLNQLCDEIKKNDLNIECTVDALKITIKRAFSPGDGFYTFSIESGFPTTIYKVVVNKIPLSKMIALQPDQQTATGVEMASVHDIDFSDKETNKFWSQGLDPDNELIKITYIVEMPGEVTKAEAGTYKADITSSKATFDLVQVSNDSAPLIIESKETNMVMILLIAFVVIIIIIAIVFYISRRSSK